MTVKDRYVLTELREMLIAEKSRYHIMLEYPSDTHTKVCAEARINLIDELFLWINNRK